MKGLLFAALLAAAPAAAPQNGATALDLRSETLTVEHGKKRAVFGGGVIATRGNLILECPEVVAEYDARSQVRLVTCEGPVRAREGERHMTAQSGYFDNTTGLLTLSGEPTLTEGARRLVGQTLVFDANKSVATISQVRGELPAAEAPDLPGAAGRGPLFVTAPKVTHELEARRTSFEGGVVATRGDLVLHTPALTATYDEAGDLKRAVSSGGPVTVRQRDRRARADRAVFTAGARSLVLEGNPQVTEGPSSLTGNRVTFLLGQDRVEVEKPRAIFPIGAALPGRAP